MRSLILLLTICVAGLSYPAHAQPVTFDEPAATVVPGPTRTPDLPTPETLKPETLAPEPLAPDSSVPESLKPETLKPETNATSALPDLTPDVVKKPTYGFTPPTVLQQQEGRSTINPRLEPWEKERRPDRAKEAQAVFAQLPYDVQNQILDETHQIHRRCGFYDTYAQFHDCDCLGSVYFEERILDPESAMDQILGRINNYCVSLPGASAYGYDQCFSGLVYLLEPSRAEDFCRCFGLQYGKNYKKRPYPDFDNMRVVARQSSEQCRQMVPNAFKITRPPGGF